MATGRRNSIEHTSVYGGTYLLHLHRSAYRDDGSLAIVAWTQDEDCIWEPYDEITTHLGGTYRENTAHVSMDHYGDLCQEFLSRGWARQIRTDISGPERFALLEFSEEFLNEICAGLRKAGGGL